MIRMRVLLGRRDGSSGPWMVRIRMNLVGYSPKKQPSPELVERRNRLGFHQRLSGHNLVLPEEFLDKHPEYLAEFGGKRQHFAKRPSQLCWSNPALQDEMGKRMKQWWEDFPSVNILSFYPADHGRFCECENCLAMGDVSTRWQKFSRILMEKAHKEGGRFWTLAYMGYRPPPEEVAEQFDFIGYTLYNGCYRQFLTSDDPLNTEVREEIARWQEKGGRMGIRGYEFIVFYEPMFVPLVSWMVDQMRWARDQKLVGYMSEIPPYGHVRGKKEVPLSEQRWTANRLNAYVAAKASWNPSLEPVALVEDWTKYLYGPAAPAMRAYYWMMEKAWRETPGNITYFLHPAASVATTFITEDLLIKANATLQEAMLALESITDEKGKTRAQEQVRLEQAMLDHWAKLHRFQVENSGSAQAYAVQLNGAPSSEEEWARGGTLPVFEDRQKQVVPDQTEVSMVWDAQALYLKIICHDPDVAKLSPNYLQHDQDIYADDCLEFFIDTEQEVPGYMHLAVNSAGARMDAKSSAGMMFDRDWNPEWSARTEKQESAWVAYITIPFKDFGGGVKKGAQWKFSINRTRQQNKEHKHSGWPDASFHNPAAFGYLNFVEQAPAKQGAILIYESGRDSSLLATEMMKAEWQMIRVSWNEEEFVRGLKTTPDMAVIRYVRGDQFALSDEVMEGALRSYVENGGKVLFVASTNIPLDRWFEDPDASVKWSGWKIDSRRVTLDSLDGKWLREPHDLRSMLQRRTTPSSAFLVNPEHWEVLATLGLESGEEGAYLMRRPFGKGMIILTSSNLGFAGGHEIFGSRNLGNAAMLVENLVLE